MILDTVIAVLRLSMVALTTLSTAGNRALNRLTSFRSKLKSAKKEKQSESCTKTGSQDETSLEKCWDQHLMKIAKTFTNQPAVSFDLSANGGPRFLLAGKHAFMLSRFDSFADRPFSIKRYERFSAHPTCWRLIESVMTSSLNIKNTSTSANPCLYEMLRDRKSPLSVYWYPAAESHTSEGATAVVLNKLYQKYIDSITAGDVV